MEIFVTDGYLGLWYESKIANITLYISIYLNKLVKEEYFR